MKITDFCVLIIQWKLQNQVYWDCSFFKEGWYMKQKIRLSRKTLKIILGVCIGAAALLVVGFFLYIHIVDKNTLGREIKIYGMNVSHLTVQKAEQKIMETFSSREISFQEDGEEIYRITMKDLGYSLDQNVLKAQLDAIKKERDADRQIFAHPVNFKIGYQVQKDEQQEQTALSASHFNNKERSASVSASIAYDEQKKAFSITKDVQGDEIDEQRLISHVNETLAHTFQEDLLGGEIRISLGTAVYAQPETVVTPEMEQKLKSLNDQLQKYRSTTVTYTFGTVTQVLDSSVIESWIRIEGDKVSLDEASVKAYVEQLAADYNTIYVPRTFRTSYGNDITVSGNEYGYRIDQNGELKQLLEDLKSGTAVSREPVYEIRGFQRNGRDDLAGSYIEVSLDNQHLWLYKDGALVTETDIVSGAPTPERETYRGAWPIPYKASPFELTSDQYGYNVKVTYWMPFVYGQGLHDASWQSSFGGNRYKTGAGSHGCINLPKDQAALIFQTIDSGYPIIIY